MRSLVACLRRFRANVECFRRGIFFYLIRFVRAKLNEGLGVSYKRVVKEA